VDVARQKIEARSQQYAEELTRSETKYVDLTGAALTLWNAWRRDRAAPRADFDLVSLC
jgi:hypothetical protein